MVLIQDDAVMPEVINERLVTAFASVTIMNANVTGQDILPIHTEDSQGPRGDESGWIQVVSARATSSEGIQVSSDDLTSVLDFRLHKLNVGR